LENFKILYLNIQGLEGKTSLLESFIASETDLHIVCISEHWLKQSEIETCFPNNFYCPSAYTRLNKIRGGTLIFVNKNIYARPLDVSSLPGTTL